MSFSWSLARAADGAAGSFMETENATTDRIAQYQIMHMGKRRAEQTGRNVTFFATIYRHLLSFHKLCIIMYLWEHISRTGKLNVTFLSGSRPVRD